MQGLQIERNKVRTSITLDPELFAWVEAKVKSYEFASFTHAVERALYLLKEIMDEGNYFSIYETSTDTEKDRITILPRGKNYNTRNEAPIITPPPKRKFKKK